jgi:hypothetical protein
MKERESFIRDIFILFWAISSEIFDILWTSEIQRPISGVCPADFGISNKKQLKGFYDSF